MDARRRNGRRCRLSLAEAIWRKRRLQQFIEFQFLKNITDPSLPSYNEHRGLSDLALVLRAEPEFALKEYAEKCLKPDMFKFLQKSFRARNLGLRQNGHRR
jgi:hypothetical protein